MPVLRNARHESFARKIAAGMTRDAAYGSAGFKRDRGHAARLAANGSIAARVGELQRKAESKFEMSRMEWLEGFARLARKAEKARDFSAAKACLREIGLALPQWYAPQKAEVVLDAKVVQKPDMAQILANPATVEAIGRRMREAPPEVRDRLKALLT
jgi:hypothetical protein